MTRMSKQGKKRAVSPRRPRSPAVKTGTKKDQLPQGFKPHENALPGELTTYIAKIK